MKKSGSMFLLILMSMLGSACAGSHVQQTSVLYVSNEGVLVTSGDKKILIDGIYAGIDRYLPADAFSRLKNGEAPFDDIDLILATHAHFDHFDPRQVAKYMAQNPHTAFLSTGEAVQELIKVDPSLEKRATAFDLVPGESREVKINGIQVNAYFLTHGINEAGEMVLNLGFLAILDEVKVFHSGDMDVNVVSVDDLKAYGLPGQQIDLAFTFHTAFRNQDVLPLVTEGLAARYYFPIHYHFSSPPLSAGLIAREFPEAILFGNEMETWVMPRQAEGDY